MRCSWSSFSDLKFCDFIIAFHIEFLSSQRLSIISVVFSPWTLGKIVIDWVYFLGK